MGSHIAQDIKAFFRNWKNNNYKKTLNQGTTGGHSSSLHASASTAQFITDAARGFIILQGDLTPKELFLHEQPDDYLKAYKDLKSKLPHGTPSVVIAQKARKQAWDTADQEYWAERKRMLELDTEG